MCSAWIPCHTFSHSSRSQYSGALSRDWGKMSFLQSEGSVACAAEWFAIRKKRSKKQGKKWIIFIPVIYYNFLFNATQIPLSLLIQVCLNSTCLTCLCGPFPSRYRWNSLKKKWVRPLKLFTETLEHDWRYFDVEDPSSSSVCFAPAVMTFEKHQEHAHKKSSSGRLPLSMVLRSLWAQLCAALSVFSGFLSLFPAF